MARREKDNLDMDSKRALELGYGVHYGRYKADHPHTMDLPAGSVKSPPVAKCLSCGEEFVKNRKDRMFCCDDCRLQYRYKTEGRPVNRNRIRLENCQLCGKPIRDLKMRRYCSIECADTMRDKRCNEYGYTYRRKKKDEQAMGEQFGGQGPDGIRGQQGGGPDGGPAAGADEVSQVCGPDGWV